MFFFSVSKDHGELRQAEVSDQRDRGQQASPGGGSEETGCGLQRDRQEDEQHQTRPDPAPQDQGPVSHVGHTQRRTQSKLNVHSTCHINVRVLFVFQVADAERSSSEEAERVAWPEE